jgi:hypothetical protein
MKRGKTNAKREPLAVVVEPVVGRSELVEELAGLIWESQTRTCCKPHHFADVKNKNERFWKKADGAGYERASLMDSAWKLLREPIDPPNPTHLARTTPEDRT